MRTWLKARTALDMAPTDAAWLAGFVDGEGSIGVWKAGRRNKVGLRSLQVSNTDLASLEHCLRITGAGNIQRKRASDATHKPQWLWRVTSQRDIAAVLAQLEPFLITKRQVVTTALTAWRDPARAA